MIKIQETMSIKKLTRTDLNKHYCISFQNKRNGYEARITLEIIGGGKNPRLSAFSSNSKLDAITKILEKIKERLIEYKNSIFLTKEISLRIYDNLMLSIQELQLTSNMDIIKLVNTIFQVLTIENNYTVQLQDNMIEMQRNYNNYVTRKPFVPENLSDNMRKFIKKYNLEHMTPYGLRHSFASFCSEKDMDQLVLMKLMGHSDFNTTQKYYISIYNKRKKLAIEKAYKSILEKEKTI